MPHWGLTSEQIRSKPWGLAERELEPSKKITDPVHGDIYLNRLERRLVDSPAVQRLRRVRQLGTTHLVYPGATHTRFSHSLGALRVTQDLLDVVVEQRNGPHPARDLFAQWSADSSNYPRRVAEATVLARLGGLLHDLCHVPFGHSVEDDLELLVEHDKNIPRFEFLWGQIEEPVRALISGELFDSLKCLILSKSDEYPARRLLDGPYAFVGDIVGNTICADLLDYLRRDHLFTGLPAALGQRFIDGFYVTRDDHHTFPRRMVMRISRDGRERADVVSELFKYLRYRYELSERALVHHAKLAADAMTGKLLYMWRESIWIDVAKEKHPRLAKNAGKNFDQLREKIESTSKAEAEEIDSLVDGRLEREFLRHGDDGLLEHILREIDAAEPASQVKDTRKAAIATLARNLQNRQLFKPIARCSGARPQAEEIHKKFGKAEKRRTLEEGAAEFAGLLHRWHTLLWIPGPDMRLKAAEVLVDKDGTISRLIDLEKVGRHRGDEIYESHQALWAITVFAAKELRDDEVGKNVALAWLATQIGIEWDDSKNIPSLPVLAARHIGDELELTRKQEEQLAKAVKAGVPARGSGVNRFDELVRRTRETAQVLFLNRETETRADEDVDIDDTSGDMFT